MEESTNLVVIEKTNVMQVFTVEGEIDPILEKITREVKGLVFDLSTAKGRKDCASAAYKVAQCKTYLDGLGKDLVTEMKELPKKVDESRRKVREYLDALRDEVRQPLTMWEEEQARTEAEAKAKREAEELAKQVETDHEIALLMNREFDCERKEAAERAEQARIEHERKIAEAAAEKARKDAEEQAERAKLESERLAKAEREAAEQRERDAKLAQERAEREKRKQNNAQQMLNAVRKRPSNAQLLKKHAQKKKQ